MATFALVFINLVFGATFVVVKDAMAHVAPVRFVALRFLVAAVVLVAIALVRERAWLAKRATWRDGALLGALLFLGYATQTAGLVFTTPAVSAFLTSTSIAMVPFLAVLLLREKLNTAAWIGVVATLAGLMLLLWPGGGIPVGPGELLSLACAASFAFHFIATAHVAKRTPPLALVAAQTTVVSALAFACLPLDHPGATPALSSEALPPKVWIQILGMGVGATALAFFLQTWAQRTVPATRVAVCFALEPVFALLFSAALTGERFGPAELVGMALILAGMLVVSLRGMPSEETPRPLVEGAPGP